jgi:hypothetical protein
MSCNRAGFLKTPVIPGNSETIDTATGKIPPHSRPLLELICESAFAGGTSKLKHACAPLRGVDQAFAVTFKLHLETSK